MNKWICIKKYVIDDELPESSPAKNQTGFCVFNISDNALIKKYDNGTIFIGPYSENDTIPMWVVDENVYDHFITMAQWRERQINSIIND